MTIRLTVPGERRGVRPPVYDPPAGGRRAARPPTPSDSTLNTGATDVLDWLFSTDGFVPRRACGAWSPELIWLHSASDVAIWLAYVSIPLALVFFARRQGFRTLRKIVWLFAAFILCCGFTHLIDATIFDHPVYRLSGVAKGVTAVVSWVTVLSLLPALPGLIRAFHRNDGLATSGEMPALPADVGSAAEAEAAARPERGARPYVAAVATSAVAVLVRWAFHPLMKSDHAFVIPLLGVVFVAWRSGFWPAVLNIAVSTVAVVSLLIDRHTFLVDRLSDQLAVGFFLFAGVACALLGQSQLESRRRAARHLAVSMAKQRELALAGEQLHEAQRRTQDTLAALMRSEKELQRSHLELEQRVSQRTVELSEAVSALQDEVTVRTAAETKGAVAAEELRRSNGELEQFAYVASHDLQEPLRKIQAFGDRLKTKCAGQLDEAGNDYLQRMLSSAGRMRQLIHDLLNLSRVTTKAAAFTPVDLGGVLAAVLGDLEERLTQSGGEVEGGPLPTVDADPTQMRQLFQNLLGNALKFQKPGVPPRVAVAAVADGDGWRISVADNGIGFDEKYADRIFQVFQRLHGREEYEGTGVGLAICDKIAQRHGGRIAARSRPGEGATFTVTLPARHPTEASPAHA